MDEELKKEIKEGFEEAIKNGLIEISGKKENGELLYRITKKGKKYVENMPFGKAIIEESADIKKAYS